VFKLWGEWGIRECSHDTDACFILIQGHLGYLLWLCIRSHDTDQFKISYRYESNRGEFTPVDFVAVLNRDSHSGTRTHTPFRFNLRVLPPDKTVCVNTI